MVQTNTMNRHPMYNIMSYYPESEFAMKRPAAAQSKRPAAVQAVQPKRAAQPKGAAAAAPRKRPAEKHVAAEPVLEGPPQSPIRVKKESEKHPAPKRDETI